MAKVTPVGRYTAVHCILLHASVRMKQWEMGLGPNLGARHIYMFLFVLNLQHMCCTLREGHRLASKNR